MDEKLMRARPIFGYLGFAALAAAVLVYLMRNQLAWYTWVLLGLAFVFLAVFGWTSREEVAEASQARQVRYGSNAVVMSVALIAILVLANVLGNRYTKRFDLTANQQFTLSEQTTTLLSQLNEPVHATAFIVADDPSLGDAQDLLKEYASHSPNNFNYEIIDPVTKPAITEQFNVKTAPTVVFSSGDQRADSTTITEAGFTSALLKLTKTTKKTIGFLTGHGERDINDQGQTGYSDFKQAIEAQNNDVKTVNLVTDEHALDGIDVLIIASPKTDLQDNEKQAIKTYLEQGGRVLVLRDPRNSADLNDLVQPYGLQLGNEILVNPQSSPPQDPSVFIAQQQAYGTHAITKDIEAFTVLPGVGAVLPKQEANEPLPTGVTSLIKSTDASWGESSDQPSFDESNDVKGPLTLAAAVEKPVESDQQQSEQQPDDQDEKATRIVAIGDSDFAGNDVIHAYANRDFVMNAVSWLAGEEDLISIRPKDVQTQPLILTSAQSNFMLISSVVLLPALVLIFGGLVWSRRR